MPIHPIDILREQEPIYSNLEPDDVKFINMLWTMSVITDEQRAAAFAIQRPEPEPETLSVRDRISLSLFRKISEFFVAMWDGVWEAGWNMSKRMREAVFGYLKDPYDTFLTRMVQDKIEDEAFAEFLPPSARTRALRFNENPNIVDALMLELYALGFFLGYLIGLIPIIAADARRSLNKKYSPEIPDIATLIRYNFRFPAEQDLTIDRASQLGYDNNEFNILTKANRPILEVNFIKDLFLRDILTEPQAIEALVAIGYSDTEANQIKALFYYIPSPPDQVRFAVREAFYPEYVAKYGLDQEYPQDFEDAVKKTGVSKEWAKMYWRSHWELPSLLMGFEMLHRGVIDEATLDDLFKAADIMPYWRDNLKAISYNPLTRVDVRRMHKIGVLDRDAVKKAYRDVGYDDKNAELMTEFTILYNQENERDLTKADILAAYKRRLISRIHTKELLSNMGYDVFESDTLISRIDYDLELTRKKLVLSNVKKMYIRGTLDEVGAMSRFGELNMPATESKELIDLWDTEKKDQSRSLTRADLDKMFKNGVIKKDMYIAELRLLNYGDRDIGLLVKLNSG